MSAPLISFSLPAHPLKVLQSTFLNESFFQDFLTIKLHNKDINQSPWTPLPTQTFEQYAKDGSPKTCLPESFQWIFPDKKGSIMRSTRDVSSSHPVSSSQSYLKLLMGFLPTYSESIKYQTLLTHTDDISTAVDRTVPSLIETNPQFFILEKASFRGLPFADIFEINTIWRFQADKKRFRSGAVKDTDMDDPRTDVSIFIHFDFKKSCWVKELIKTGTKSELKEVLLQWRDYATDTLSRFTSPQQFRTEISHGSDDLHETKDPNAVTIKVNVKKIGGKKIHSWLNKLPWRQRRHTVGSDMDT